MQPHSYQPILRVNPSPEFVNLYFPYAGQGLLLFRWWQRRFEFQLARVAVKGKSSDVQNTHAQLKISLPTRFLAYCTRPVSVHLAMASVGCSFNSFSVFCSVLHNNKISWSLCFPVFIFQYGHIPPKSWKKQQLYFIQVNCMGWQVCNHVQPLASTDRGTLQ